MTYRSFQTFNTESRAANFVPERAYIIAQSKDTRATVYELRSGKVIGLYRAGLIAWPAHPSEWRGSDFETTDGKPVDPASRTYEMGA